MSGKFKEKEDVKEFLNHFGGLGSLQQAVSQSSIVLNGLQFERERSEERLARGGRVICEQLNRLKFL